MGRFSEETEMFSMLTVVMISCVSTHVKIDLIIHVKYVQLIYFNYISIIYKRKTVGSEKKVTQYKK